MLRAVVTKAGRLTAAGCALLAALLACAGEGERPLPVVLVVVDTLRADRVDPAAVGPLSPELARRLAAGRRYRRAFAPSPWTLPSFASLYTGRFPSRHGAGSVVMREGRRDFTRLDDGVPTLAERLSARGYATGAIVGNAALAPEFGMARGFQGYDYAPATNAFTRRADAVVDRAIAWIDARGEAPFFLVVHLFDPHMNYDAPPPFRGRFTARLRSGRSLPVDGARELRRRPDSVSEPDRRFIAAAYDEEVAFATTQVARLLGALGERGLLERGLVILTSDHGEELFEHGGFEHGHALWQEVLALPLVVWGAGVAAGEETAPVSLVDLAPTIVAATAAEPLPEPDGTSLWGNLTRGAGLPERALVAEGSLYGPERKALIRWPLKLVWNLESGERALFELSADPAERDPLTQDARAEALAQELEARAVSAAGAPAKLAPGTLEALRELGYAE
jgi:arylsulfatase A-like enzyme